MIQIHIKAFQSLTTSIIETSCFVTVLVSFPQVMLCNEQPEEKAEVFVLTHSVGGLWQLSQLRFCPVCLHFRVSAQAADSVWTHILRAQRRCQNRRETHPMALKSSALGSWEGIRCICSHFIGQTSNMAEPGNVRVGGDQGRYNLSQRPGASDKWQR